MKKVHYFVANFSEFIKSRALSHTFYLALSLFLGYFSSGHLAIEEVRFITGGLQNISAAVFTLSGIWIAYSYPQAIAAYTSPDSVQIIPGDDARRIEGLVLIILSSAFVISSILIFDWAYLVVSGLEVYSEIREGLKVIGVSFIMYLSLVQLKAIFS